MTSDIAAIVWLTFVLVLVGLITITAFSAYALWWLVDRTLRFVVYLLSE